MHTIQQYQDFFSTHIFEQTEKNRSKEPQNLYEPINYILSDGGKRIRPVLTLMTAEIFGIDFKKAMDAATAVEVFHNFSLVHDDIMDDAPLRRGKTTVHEKWNINTGILSGDAMLILAYQYFEGYEPRIFQALAKLFSKTALEVCEGQQFDVDFETRTNVTIPEYIQMISFKTAVLVGAAMKMGAIIAETSQENADLIYNFGLNLGIAFQLQDDYLDAFGDPKTFGKQVGGDIIENKKTYLFLKAIEKGTANQKQELLTLFTSESIDIENKITQTKTIFVETGASSATEQAIKEYTFKALETLEKLDISQEKKTLLNAFATNLMSRKV
jgi:geranylgeranyl diphosphate synthase, type II